ANPADQNGTWSADIGQAGGPGWLHGPSGSGPNALTINTNGYSGTLTVTEGSQGIREQTIGFNNAGSQINPNNTTGQAAVTANIYGLVENQGDAHALYFSTNPGGTYGELKSIEVYVGETGIIRTTFGNTSEET